MKVKVKIVNKDIDQNREFEVLEEYTNCYILKYDDGKFLTVKKEWCEVVEESKINNIKIKSMVNVFLYGLKNGEIYNVIDEDEKQYIINTVKGRIAVCKDWFEVVKEEEETISKNETVKKEYELTEKQFREKSKGNSWDGKFEKDIELPNEFYFKEISSGKDYKAIKNDCVFNIFTVVNNKLQCHYYKTEAKENVKNKKWIIIETPINKEKELQEHTKYINDKYLDVKKTSKFITLTTIEDFKVEISKDKIVSVLQYEDKCFITTVAIEGTFTVKEFAEDIIKMLEE